MRKHMVENIKDLTYDYGEDGDIAIVANSNTNHITATPVTYTKVNGVWRADKWYSISGAEVTTIYRQGQIAAGVEDPSVSSMIFTNPSIFIKIPLYDSGYTGLTINFKPRRGVTNDLIYQLQYYDSDKNYLTQSVKYRGWTRNGEEIIIPAAKNIIPEIRDCLYVRVVIAHENKTDNIVPFDLLDNFTYTFRNRIYDFKHELLTIGSWAMRFEHDVLVQEYYYSGQIANYHFSPKFEGFKIPIPIGARYFTLYCDNNVNENFVYYCNYWSDNERQGDGFSYPENTPYWNGKPVNPDHCWGQYCGNYTEILPAFDNPDYYDSPTVILFFIERNTPGINMMRGDQQLPHINYWDAPSLFEIYLSQVTDLHWTWSDDMNVPPYTPTSP